MRTKLRMELKRAMASILALALILSTMSTAVFAVDYPDTKGHWGESAIQRWSDYGIVQGADGKFNPGAPMTRKEMATVLSNLLGLKDKAASSFADVPAGAWYEDAILKCAAAGILKGDGTGANPDGTITRQEAAVMMGRALGIEPASASTSFADSGQIAGWASGYVKAMVDKGIINGMGNNLFAPTKNIDRASVVTILDKAITTYINKPGDTVTASGSGLTVIAAPDVTVKGTVNDLVVAPAAENSAVTLDDAKVSGTATVQGKGTSLALTGTASAQTVVLAAESAKITVGEKAVANNVTLQAKNATVDVAGKVTNVAVEDQATGAAVKAQKTGTITTVTTSAKGTTVSGEGTVSTVRTFDKEDTKVSTKDTKVELTTAKPEEPKPPVTSGGGTSGGGPSYKSVTVKTPEELQKQFADNYVTKITLEGDGFTGKDITLERTGSAAVAIEFGTVSLGEISINAKYIKELALNDAATGGAKCRNLTVNAPKAHVTNNLEVTGTITVEAVAANTFVVGDKASFIKMNGAGKLDVQAENVTPEVEIATDQNVVLAGSMGGVTVAADGAKVEVAAETTVAKITSTATQVAIDVKTEAPVKLEGEIQTVALNSNAELEVAAGASVGQLTTTVAGANVTGGGEIAEVTATQPITLANAKVGTVEATAPITLNTAVDKVNAKSAAVTISGTGSVAEVEATKPVTISNNIVDKVTIPDTAKDVTITVAKEVTIPVVETKANVEIAGAGSVSTVDVSKDNVTVTAAAESVAQVTAVGEINANSVTVKGTATETIAVKIKAAVPTGITFVEPAEAAGKGKITTTDHTNLEYSADNVTYTDLSQATSVDAGKTYYVRTKATEAALASEAVSGYIPATVGVSKATISGTPIVGNTLTAAANADATSTPGHPMVYTWAAGGQTIEKETGKTLTVADSMVGQTITVTIKNYEANSKTATTAVVEADKTALKQAINAANIAKTGIQEGAAAAEVLLGVEFVTTEQMTAFNKAITDAQAVVDLKEATANTAYVAAATKALEAATATFNKQKQTGTLDEVADLQKALGVAITAAETAKADIAKSANGLDVAPDKQWVTQEVATAFEAAVKAANDAKANTDATVLSKALADLNAATVSYNTAKRYGEPIDVSKLLTAIQNANHNQSSVVGVKTGTTADAVEKAQKFVTTEQLSNYQTAIETAAKAAEAPQNQAAVNAAIAALDQATTAFDKAKQTGTLDKGALAAAIKAATANLNSVKTEKPDIGYWVTQEVYNVYQTAITTATNTLNQTDLTQPTVDKAIAALNAATEAFNKAKSMAVEVDLTFAPLHDTAGVIADDQLIKNPAMTVAKDGTNFTLTYSGTDLQYHQAGDTAATMGYWLGFGIVGDQDTATKIAYSWDNAEAAKKAVATSKVGFDGYDTAKKANTFYVNAANAKAATGQKCFVAVQTGTADPVIYTLDFSGVTLAANTKEALMAAVKGGYDVTIPAGVTIQLTEKDTLTIPAGATLTINGTLDATASTIANNGTLAGTGAIMLAENGEYTGTVVSGAVFTVINDKASHKALYDQLDEAGKTALGEWDENSTPQTLPWIGVTYARNLAEGKAANVTLTLQSASDTYTETLSGVKNSNPKAFVTVNADGNQGLPNETYTATLQVEVGGLTTVVSKTDIAVTATEQQTVTTLGELQAKLAAGQNAMLGADITTSDVITVSKSATIDLNGHTLTSTYTNATAPYAAIEVTGDGTTLTIRDASAGKKGLITANGANGNTIMATEQATVNLISGTVANTAAGRNVLRAQSGNIVMDGGKVYTENGYGIAIFGNNSNVTVNGGTIEASLIAISSMGTISACNGYTLTINGGTITNTNNTTDSDSAAIYMPGTGGVANITGGTISSPNVGIAIRSGQLNINGGAITANAARNENGTLVNGRTDSLTGAIVIGKPATTSEAGYVGDIAVNIKDAASITNEAGDKIVVDARHNPKNNNVTVTGGGNKVVITDPAEFTDYAGDIAIEGNTKLVSNVDSLEAALAKGQTDNQSIMLMADIDIDAMALTNAIAGKTNTIDLNKKTLTVSGTNTVMLEMKEKATTSLTLKNGKLNAENTQSIDANFNINAGCSIELDGVDVTATGTVLFPRGNAASVTVNKSSITTSGVYAIATNAATDDNYQVVITVKDSVLETTATDGDSCAMCINVPSTVNVTNTEITGQRQGVLVRAGDVKLINCTITADIKQVRTGTNYYSENAWGSGNEVPYGAVVVGKTKVIDDYAGPIKLDLADSTLSCTTTDEALKNYASAFYALNNDSVKTVTVTGSCTVTAGNVINRSREAVDLTDLTVNDSNGDQVTILDNIPSEQPAAVNMLEAEAPQVEAPAEPQQDENTVTPPADATTPPADVTTVEPSNEDQDKDAPTNTESQETPMPTPVEDNGEIAA